jgi:hypothetical protein
LERNGAELASGMGFSPSMRTNKDYHRETENVNFPGAKNFLLAMSDPLWLNF